MKEPIENALHRALAHLNAGENTAAANLYRDVLKRVPDHSEALHLLGLTEQRLGELDAALLHIAKAVQIEPDVGLYRLNLGVLLTEAGRSVDAVAMLRSVLEQDDSMVEAHYALGNALDAVGDLPGALASFRRSAVLQPDHSQTLNNIGLILREMGEIEEAIDHLEKAVQTTSPFPSAFSNLCAAYSDAGRLMEAILAGRTAVSQSPHDANAHYNLGNAIAELEVSNDAVDNYCEAVRIAPDFTDAWINLGVAYLRDDYPASALEAFDRALSLDHQSADAHWNRSLTLLKLGRLAEGWPGYDWRWKAVPWLDRREFDAPQWRGETLNGQTVLVHAEQGYGDTIQFVRYLPEILRRGGTVKFACQPALKRLLSSLPGMESVTGYGEPAGAFDFHLPIMSLPEAITLEDPATAAQTIPYLSVPMVDIKIPSGDMRPKVGLVWRGSRINNKGMFRSCRLVDLEPLIMIDAHQFYALQPDVEEVERPILSRYGVVDLSSQIADFADSAALTAAMDLVISVDTAQAHLAGALGRPVWTLLAKGADWRWFIDRDDSPWYPTMRLFRQETRGDWRSLFACVAEALPRALPSLR